MSLGSYAKPVDNPIAAMARDALMATVTQIKEIGLQAGQALSGVMSSISSTLQDVSLSDISVSAGGPAMPRGPDIEIG